jgi:hypothetical protein
VLCAALRLFRFLICSIFFKWVLVLKKNNQIELLFFEQF